MIYDAIGWVGIVIVLGVYLWRRPSFDLANAVLWPAVAAPSVAHGVWGPAFISFAFGVVGTFNLWSARPERRRRYAETIAEANHLAHLAAYRDELARRRRMNQTKPRSR